MIISKCQSVSCREDHTVEKGNDVAEGRRTKPNSGIKGRTLLLGGCSLIRKYSSFSTSGMWGGS